MADRPCRLRLREWLLAALLLSGSMTAHAVGIAAPQVMSGFNEPLKARVALLDTGALRASDLRVSLADSDRWQAMDIMRSADTDTLQLAVNGTPGHLYLDIGGSRALEAPWLDVVLTIRWPQGELTPQLTLLPSTDAATAKNVATAAASERRAAASAPAATAPATRHTDRPAREAPAPAQDDRRVAVLEAKLERLEQALQTRQQEQAALLAELESVRAQALLNQRPPDTAEIEALTLRQQALETRLAQLDKNPTATDVAAPEAALQDNAALPQASLQDAAVIPEPPGAGRDNSFIWVYALAALLLMTAGTWALVRRWRQQRYRLVSAAELAPMGETHLHSGDVPAADEGSGSQQQAAGVEHNEAWAAHREHIDALCREAEVFHRHHRRDHAITMLREGLEHYPNDFQLIRALAVLEEGSGQDSPDAEQRQEATPITDTAETPTLAPLWSLKPDATHAEVIDPMPGITPDKGADFSITPAVAFPQGWTLEEVAFEGADTDNERPNADRFSRHA